MAGLAVSLPLFTLHLELLVTALDLHALLLTLVSVPLNLLQLNLGGFVEAGVPIIKHLLKQHDLLVKAMKLQVELGVERFVLVLVGQAL